MTKRQSSLERLGNLKVTFDDATDQILGLVDAQGQERQLVTAATGLGGGVELLAGGVTLGTPVVAVTSPGGEITDLNVDGENLNLVRAVASPGGEVGITNIQSLTQAQYDALTTVATTLYVIVE